jgi:hypothetical protein
MAVYQDKNGKFFYDFNLIKYGPYDTAAEAFAAEKERKDEFEKKGGKSDNQN